LCEKNKKRTNHVKGKEKKKRNIDSAEVVRSATFVALEGWRDAVEKKREERSARGR